MELRRVNQEQFVREISISKNIGLFLGAGASASSGIPTAYEMTLNFKRRLFASEKGVDLTLIYQRPYEFEREIEIWAKLKFGTNIENAYGFFFEKCFPSKAARSQHIRELLGTSKPSIGYKILAVLVKHGLFHDIFTTNFDNLVQTVLPNGVEITENNISNYGQVVRTQGFPLIFKLHGDFREDWLRNLPEETRKLHGDLEKTVVDRMRVLEGLVVIGYSGRDESVKEMFQKAFQEKGIFPYGLFWCARHGKINDSVKELLTRAANNGINVAIVDINDFDELMIDIYRQTTVKDSSIDNLIEQLRTPRPFSINIRQQTGKNLIVHNFLPILEYPKHFWVLDKNLLNVRSWKDLDNITKGSDNSLILSFFRKEKIIALGDESMVKHYLNIEQIEPYSITIADLKRLNRGAGFLFSIYHKILKYHFENFMKLRSIDKHTVVDKDSVDQINDIKFHHALHYHFRVINNQLYFVIRPDYIVLEPEDNAAKTLKTSLLGHFKNKDFFKHLWVWQKRLKEFGNGELIYFYGPPRKTVRFVVGAKFMKSQEA